MRFFWVVLAGCGRVGFAAHSDAGDTAQDTRGDSTAPVANVAFVTSTTHDPSSFGGFPAADAICAQRAMDASLDGTFVAYLSSSTTNATDRLAGARGWVRPDGRMIADTAADLAAGNLVHGISLDEAGNDLGAGPAADPGYAVTATQGGVLGTSSCADFTDPSMLTQFGNIENVHSLWSEYSTSLCSTISRLYCFQIDMNAPITAVTAPGRIAFVTTGVFDPSTGIAAADALCTTEASSAGLGGTFRALLPSGGQSAMSRFDPNGLPWVRRDGVPLAATVMDLMQNRASASLDVTADNVKVTSLTYVITGSDSPEYFVSGEDCNDWSSGATTGNNFGITGGIGHDMFNKTSGSCAAAAPIYCLEQ